MTDGNDDYYCWFRCLYYSDRSKWEPHVEEAFGHAHGLEWEEWWEATKHLFEAPDKFAVQVIESAEDYDYWTVGDGSDVAVVINLLTPKRELMSAIRDLLNERHSGKRGRPERDDFSDWRVTGRPNTRAINKAIDIWVAKLSLNRSPLWEIGLFYEVNPSQVPKDGDPSGDQKRILASTVSRYLKRANELIAGVEKGVFPA